MCLPCQVARNIYAWESNHQPLDSFFGTSPLHPVVSVLLDHTIHTIHIIHNDTMQFPMSVSSCNLSFFPWRYDNGGPYYMLSIEFELNAYNYVMLCESPPSNEGVIPLCGSLLTPPRWREHPRSSHCCWLKLMLFFKVLLHSTWMMLKMATSNTGISSLYHIFYQIVIRISSFVDIIATNEVPDSYCSSFCLWAEFTILSFQLLLLLSLHRSPVVASSSTESMTALCDSFLYNWSLPFSFSRRVMVCLRDSVKGHQLYMC